MASTFFESSPSLSMVDREIEETGKPSTLEKSFLETELDARLVVEACRCGQLPFCTRSPRETPCLSGSIFAYDCEASGFQDCDSIFWTFEDFDDMFNLWCYRQWETVTGAFIPPTRCESFTSLCEGWAALAFKSVPSWSCMERIRLAIEKLGPKQIVFMQTVILVILSWTDECYHEMLLSRDVQLLFPNFPTNSGYWDILSRRPMFESKTTELMDQTEALLSVLFQVADPAAKIFRPVPISRHFSPLQNISIIFELFRVTPSPMGTFRWLGGAKIHEAAEKFRILDGRPEHIALPIDIRGSFTLETRQTFAEIFNRISVQDQVANEAWMNIACEVFPSFRQPEHFERLLHLTCCNSSISATFRGWTTSRDGEHVRSQLFQSFRGPLLPEQLALSLVMMLNLCPDHPPNLDIQSPSWRSLASLDDLLQSPHTTEESYTFLFHFIGMFAYTVRCMGDEEGKTDCILDLLVYFTRGVSSMHCADPALHSYWLERWNGKDHADAMIVAHKELAIWRRSCRRRTIP